MLTLYELDWVISTSKAHPTSTIVKSPKLNSSVTRFPEPTIRPDGLNAPRHHKRKRTDAAAPTTMMTIKRMARRVLKGLLSLSTPLLSGLVGGPTGVPHVGQNFAPSSNLAPHFEQ